MPSAFAKVSIHTAELSIEFGGAVLNGI